MRLHIIAIIVDGNLEHIFEVMHQNESGPTTVEIVNFDPDDNTIDGDRLELLLAELRSSMNETTNWTYRSSDN